ncbi:MAG: hypothetical protein Q9164_001701 [Protoblastenia rupestris]
MADFLNGDISKWYPTNGNEDNAKRLMLVGTALLTTLDLLIKRDIIRNIGFIFGRLLNFVSDMEETCGLEEDARTIPVIQKVDKHKIEIKGSAQRDEIVDGMRKAAIIVPYAKGDVHDEDWNDPLTRQDLTEAKLNMIKAYEPTPTPNYSGMNTSETQDEGTERHWCRWDWTAEVRLLCNLMESLC